MKYICYNAWIYPSDCFLLKCRATERGKDRDLLSAGPKDLNHSPMLSCAHQQGTRLEEEPPGPNLCALGSWHGRKRHRLLWYHIHPGLLIF